MNNSAIRELVTELNESAIILGPFEKAFLGTVRRIGHETVAAYDYDMVMADLTEACKGEGVTPIELFNAVYNKPNIESFPLFICKYPSLEAAVEAGWPEFLSPDGFEASFVGVTIGSDEMAPIGVFSYEKCVTIMMDNIIEDDKEDEDPRTTAIEYLEYNTLGSYISDDAGNNISPFFLENEVDELETAD